MIRFAPVIAALALYFTHFVRGFIGGPGDVPTFTNISALDRYYHALRQPRCDDACKSDALDAAGKPDASGTFTMRVMNAGIGIGVVRVVSDPSDVSRKLCAVFMGGPRSDSYLGATWTLCENLGRQP